MNIFLTLDYELFFGSSSGTLEKSIVNPTKKLINILDRFGIKATFFIDAGYLVKLKKLSKQHELLKQDFEIIASQISFLSKNGHSIQLHIHPHWEDANYIDGNWSFDTRRFTLNDFSEDEVDRIVGSYKEILEDITKEPVFAFRAGGWCIQPFSHLAKAFKKHKIWLDSTVFKGGYYCSQTHKFDFTNAPDKDCWKFSEDVVKEEVGGMIELPISSYKVTPMFYWKSVLLRLLSLKKHKIYGDGAPIGAGIKDVLRLLTSSSCSVASIDGLRISFLQKALSSSIQKGHQKFVILGHPKAFSDYSLDMLEEFCNINVIDHEFSCISEIEFLR